MFKMKKRPVNINYWWRPYFENCAKNCERGRRKTTDVNINY
jgi:hypothetical protein